MNTGGFILNCLIELSFVTIGEQRLTFCLRLYQRPEIASFPGISSSRQAKRQNLFTVEFLFAERFADLIISHRVDLSGKVDKFKYSTDTHWKTDFCSVVSLHCSSEPSIYIYKTVVCDRVLTLYRPCAYPGAVLRHASGPTGPRNSSRSFCPFIKSSLPGSSKSRCSRKQTQPSLSKINNSTLKMKLFLSKGFF